MDKNNKAINVRINTDTVLHACERILKETQESILFGLVLIQNCSDASGISPDSLGGSEFRFQLEPREKDINVLKAKLKRFLLTKAFEDFIKAIDASMQKAYEILLIKEWINDNKRLQIREATTSLIIRDKMLQKFGEFAADAAIRDFDHCYKRIKHHLKAPLSLLDEISTIRRVRNCLVHGNGVVTQKYVNDKQNGVLKLKWICIRMSKISNGKKSPFEIGNVVNTGDQIIMDQRYGESYRFNKGDNISLNLQQIYDVLYTCYIFSRELAQNIVIGDA